MLRKRYLLRVLGNCLGQKRPQVVMFYDGSPEPGISEEDRVGFFDRVLLSREITFPDSGGGLRWTQVLDLLYELDLLNLGQGKGEIWGMLEFMFQQGVEVGIGLNQPVK